MPFRPNRSLLLMVERILPLLCPVEGDCSLCEARGTRQAGSQEVKLLSCVPAWPLEFDYVVTLIFHSLIFSSPYVKLTLNLSGFSS